MLHIITGEPGSGKTYFLYEQIASCVKKSIPSFLLIPEQYTAVSEATMASFLPPDATLSFEVTSFSRLANTVFRAEGGLSYRYATKTTRALLIWQTQRLLAPFFREQRSEDASNVQKTLAAIEELHAAGIHSGDMKKAAMALPEENRLKNRLHDLSLIDATYRDLLSSKYDDAAEDLDRLALLLKTSRFFQGKTVFCDSFTSFTEQEYAILSRIAATAELYITLPIASYAEESQAFLEPIRTLERLHQLASKNGIPVEDTALNGNRRTRSSRLCYVSRHLWDADTTKMKPFSFEKESPNEKRTSKPVDSFPSDPTDDQSKKNVRSDIATAAHNEISTAATGSVCIRGEAGSSDHDGQIFASPTEEKDLRLILADDPYTAAEWLSADIARRVQEGARFRDFAIIAKNADNYSGILDKALEKNKISYYMSTKIDINSLEAVKMIHTVYTIFRGNYRHTDVISFLKCGYSDINDADADRFELYLEKWRISGRSAYLKEKPWARHPDGYSNRFTDRDRALLVRLNEIRDTLMTPIFLLEEESSRAKTVLDHTRALYRFMTALSLPSKLREQAKKSLAAGYRAVSEGQARLFRTLTDALEALCDALGETEVGTETFAELLSIALSEVSMGRIPTSIDECTVGNADLVRMGDVKHVYLFGVNEGEFPAPVSESSTFSESDRTILEKLGLPLSPDVEIRASRELFSFLRAFSSATESVTLISSREDSAFGATVPSVAFHRVGILGGIDALRSSSLPALSFLYSEEAAAERLGRLSGTALGASVETVLSESEKNCRHLAMTAAQIIDASCHVDPRLTERIYGKRFSLTQSQLDLFVDCPFSYFCRYVLRLREEEPADFSFRDIGNFIHDALDIFFGVLAERGLSISTASEAETAATIAEACNRAQNALFPEGNEPSPRLLHRLHGLRDRATIFSEELREEFHQSLFSPVFHELTIGERTENGIASTAYRLPDGTELTLHGKIDRVDAYTAKDGRTYIRVVDYKTGSKIFSPEDLERGKNLQLFVYLFALCQDENGAFRRRLGTREDIPVVPAGMLYMETAAKALAIPELSSKEEVRESVKKSIGRSGYLLNNAEILEAMEKERAGRFIPSTQKKPGDLLSEEGFADVANRLSETLTRIGFSMRSGCADANPLTDKHHGGAACEHCPMKAVCRNANIKK